MKDFGISPEAWGRLDRFTKRCLHYHRVMEQHYMREAQEEQKREMEKEKNRQKFLASLPRQVPRLRRS